MPAGQPKEDDVVRVFAGRRVEAVYAIALLASLIVLAATGGAWALLLVSIIALAHALPARGAIIGTTVARFLIATLTVLMLYQVESVIAWVCRVHASPPLYVLGAAAVVGVLWVLARRRGTTARLTFRREDVTLLLPALLLTGLYLAHVILPSEDDSRSMLRATSVALDDTSHMAMLNGLVRNDVNLPIDNLPVPVMALSEHATYPMGWHVSNAVLLTSFDPAAKTANLDDFIVSYFVIKVLTLGLVVLALTILTFRVASHFGFSIRRLWPVLSVYTGIGYITALVVVSQFVLGFFSFLGLMIYTLVFVTLIIDAWRREDRGFGIKDAVLLLCVIASALTWLLTAPALLVTYLILKLHQSKTFRGIPWTSWVGSGIAGMFFLFQVWDVTHGTGSVITVLAAPGGILAPEPLLLFGLVLTLILLAGMKRFRPVTSPVVVSTLPLLLIACLILGYIGLKSQTISYYFLKYEFILILVMMPLALVALMQALRRAALGFSPLWRSAGQYGAFLAVIILAIPSLIGYTYVESVGYLSFEYPVTRNDAVILDNALAHQFSPANKRIFFYFESTSRTIMTAQVARTIFPNTTCDTEMFGAEYTVDQVGMNTVLQKCIGDFGAVVIYTEPAAYAKLDAAISPMLIQSHQVTIQVEPA